MVELAFLLVCFVIGGAVGYMASRKSSNEAKKRYRVWVRLHTWRYYFLAAIMFGCAAGLASREHFTVFVVFFGAMSVLEFAYAAFTFVRDKKASKASSIKD